MFTKCVKVSMVKFRQLNQLMTVTRCYKVHPEHLLQYHNEFMAEYLNAICKWESWEHDAMDFGYRKLIENYKDKYMKEDEFLSRKNNFLFCLKLYLYVFLI